MQSKLVVPVCQCRGQFFGAVDATPVDHHDDLFPGVAKNGHHLMDILAKILAVKMRDDFIEDSAGRILHGANHVEQHATGDAAPGAMAHPGLAFQAFFPFDLTLAQRACRQAITLGATPPPYPWQGKAPQDGFIGIQ